MSRALIWIVVCLMLCSIIPASSAEHHSPRNVDSSAAQYQGQERSANPVLPHYLAPAPCSSNSLGTIVLPGQGDEPAIALLHLLVTSLTGAVLRVEHAILNPTGTQFWIDYSLGSATGFANASCPSSEVTVRVTVKVAPDSAALKITLDADRPVIGKVDMGKWDTDLRLQEIAVPYYSGNVWYAQESSRFMNAWWLWNASQGTEYAGTAIHYERKTDGVPNVLHEEMMVAISSDVAEVFPTIPNSPSPYLAQISGKLLIDIFDEDFATTTRGLRELKEYGISNCIGIIHHWQHGGFDNELPQHYPANPGMGGDEGLQQAIAAGRADGCLMGLHENYVDYYPNYPEFRAAAIALKSDGTRIKNWFNVTTGIQAFQTKPNWMVQNAQKQSPVIHQRYGTTASYIDVNSAVGPDRMQDLDASQKGAGTMQRWIETTTALWAFERKAHEGPVFGEGLNHWYYSGLLDGAEAQLGAGRVEMNLGETLPLFVDFDLLRIHPLEVNQGMGLYERWARSPKGENDERWLSGARVPLTTKEQDAYRMQEIAFGHAPFLGRWSWDVVPVAMVESNLVTPVAASYGLQPATKIQYRVGREWVSSSFAARTGAFAQVQVSYANGLQVVANSAAPPLLWRGITIPQYGWAASGPGVLAYTAQCGSTICDFAQTPDTIFANARHQQDERNGWKQAIVSISEFQQRQNRRFTLRFAWNILRPLDQGRSYTAFVHFVNDSKVKPGDEGVVFQADHPLNTNSGGSLGETIPDQTGEIFVPDFVPDGSYSVRVGLYEPATGNRLGLAGQADHTMRIIAGRLTIAHRGANIIFEPAIMPDDPRLNAAGSLVDFGVVRTDGMISLRRQGGRWVLRVLPQYRNVTILFRSSDVAKPARVDIDDRADALAIPPAEGAYWRLTARGAVSYSWPAGSLP